MDNSDYWTLQLLGALAEARDRFMEFQGVLKSKDTVSEVIWDIECVNMGVEYVNHKSRLVLEMFMEAHLKDGRYVLWTLDVEHDGERWQLEPQVRWNGDEPVLELETRSVTSASDMVQALPIVLDSLLGSLDKVEPRLEMKPTFFVWIDIDDLKGFNQRFGIQKGDALLREVGLMLTRVMPPSSYILHYGRDKFFVALDVNGETVDLLLGQALEELRRLPSNVNSSVTFSAAVCVAGKGLSDRKSVV